VKVELTAEDRVVLREALWHAVQRADVPDAERERMRALRALLDTADDSALGLERLVRLRDVMEALWAGADAKDPNADAFWFRESADYIERKFSASTSGEKRSGAE
jgi:hypothetical protein